MTPVDLVRNAILGRRVSSGGWIRVNCPFCEQRKGTADTRHSFGVKEATGRWHCYRCESWGYLRGDGFVPRLVPKPTVTGFQPPSHYISILSDKLVGSKVAQAGVDYVRKRRVPEVCWQDAAIGLALTGVDAYRVIVPCLNPDGSWWGWFGRSWVPCDLGYKTAPGMSREKLYNARALAVETERPVLVVEGVLDALPYWPDAVACLGKPGEPQFDRLLDARRPVAVCLDGDAWEEARVLAWRLKMRGRRAGFVRLPAASDPNSIDQDWLRAAAAECVAG